VYLPLIILSAKISPYSSTGIISIDIRPQNCARLRCHEHLENSYNPLMHSDSTMYRYPCMPIVCNVRPASAPSIRDTMSPFILSKSILRVGLIVVHPKK